jgi:hypothetical protein
MNQATSVTAYSKVLRTVAKVAQIELVTAVKSKRHNPILDAEIHIEEELINLQESVASLAAAGDTVHRYPKMYSYIAREKRAILKHCIGLVTRMVYGKNLPRPYTRADVDHALRKLVQLIVLEAKRAGRQLDDDIMATLRPFLTVRQRVAMRDFGMDLVVQASQLRRASVLASRLQQMNIRWR